jgi:RNA polymerase sigma-70 factor, ECF subfamily
MNSTQPLSERGHFEAVVRRYQGPLLRYVCARLNEHDAQDVVQDVFLRLHKTMTRDGLKGITHMSTWLFRVAHNRATDLMRKRGVDARAKQAIAETPTANGAGERGGLDEVVHREDCRLVLGMLDKLPPQQREVLLLRVSQGMSYRQIGEVTQRALGTVGYFMNQGLGTLAKELKAAGVI